MAGKKTSKKYVDLISKSDAEKQSEQITLDVELAQNALKQGQLSIKAKMIGAESDLAQAKTRVSSAEKSLEIAKGRRPLNVQSLLDARTQIQQDQLNVDAAEKIYKQYAEAYDFLVATEQELF